MDSSASIAAAAGVPKPHCPLCGRAGASVYTDLSDQLYEAPGLWSVRVCAACALMWLDPQLSGSDFHTAYKSYYTHTAADGQRHKRQFRHRMNHLSRLLGQFWLGYGSTSRTIRWLARATGWLRPMREMAEMHFGRVAGPPHGKVLEVGCGGGQLLLNLRDVGWQATGLEIDEHAVRAARAHGLNVFQGGIATTEISETGFDLIILNHVIEHLSDPVGCLRKCAAMLVPNGRLVIVTPNSDGLSHRRFGHSWRGLEVPRHLVLFSPRSLEAAARAAGLVPRKVQTLIRAARFMHRQSSLMRTGANRIEIDHAMPLVERLIRLSGACLFQIAEWLTAIRDPNAGDEIYMELETLGVKGTHK